MTFRKLAAIAALATTAAQAHPGHEPFSEGTKHFISNPVHFLPILIFAVALFLAARFLQHRAARASLQIISAIIVIVALFA
jgi:hypothetical protein